MASGLIAGAALAGALSWIPWPHKVHPDQPKPPRDHHHRYEKRLDKAAMLGAAGGARYVNQGGRILIPAGFKDRGPYLFLLDTGSAHSSIDARTADQAGIPFWGENASPPSTAKEPSARRLAATSFEIGKAKLLSAEPHALYKPYNLVGSARGRLGTDLLEGYVLRIDPRYRMATLYNPMRFSRPINATALPITIGDDGGLYVPVTLRLKDGSAVTRQAKLDTGLPWTMADDASVVSQIAAVDLGDWSVPQAAGQGPGVGAPSVGMGLLNRFIVTIDVPDRTLWLQSAGTYKPDFQYTAKAAASAEGQPAPAPARKKKRFVIF